MPPISALKAKGFLNLTHCTASSSYTCIMKRCRASYTIASSGTPSGTPTLLRLISSFDESDGRFVHLLGSISGVFIKELLTTKSSFTILFPEGIHWSFNELSPMMSLSMGCTLTCHEVVILLVTHYWALKGELWRRYTGWNFKERWRLTWSVDYHTGSPSTVEGRQALWVLNGVRNTLVGDQFKLLDNGVSNPGLS